LFRQLLILGAALVLLGLVLLLMPARGEGYYRDATDELENTLERPETLEILDACYDDERVMIEFDAETDEEESLEVDRAVYHYTGNMEGVLELYAPGDFGHGFFRCREGDIEFPTWLIDGRMGPRRYIGMAASASGVAVFGYALYMKQRQRKSANDS